MKYNYTLNTEVDTNDGDYINKEVNLGIFDDENPSDMCKLVATMLALSSYSVDDGYSKFDLDEFLKECNTYKVHPGDIDEDFKEFDFLVEYEATKLLPEDVTSENILDIKDNCEDSLCEYINEWKPWMDNCDNDHDFSYDITRIPADVKVQSVYLKDSPSNILDSLDCTDSDEECFDGDI